jgi:hypothetical protein
VKIILRKYDVSLFSNGLIYLLQAFLSLLEVCDIKAQKKAVQKLLLYLDHPSHRHLLCQVGR